MSGNYKAITIYSLLPAKTVYKKNKPVGVRVLDIATIDTLCGPEWFNVEHKLDLLRKLQIINVKFNSISTDNSQERDRGERNTGDDPER